MHAVSLAVLTLLAGAPSAGAQLEIHGVQPAYGKAGPEREQPVYYPDCHDHIFYRFRVAGAAVPEAGKEVSLRFHISLADGKGALVLSELQSADVGPVLGAGPVTCYADLELPSYILPPGEYTFRVRVVDNATSQEVSFERRVTVAPPRFAIVAVGLSFDLERERPAATTVPVGETLHVVLALVGADRSGGEARLSTETRVADAVTGKELGRGEVALTPAVLASSVRVGCIISLGRLSRPGSFSAHVRITDCRTKQVAEVKVPYKVVAP